MRSTQHQPRPGFDRVALRGQVVAVQVEADLEPQGVAGAEPAGDDAGVEQLRPDRRRDLGVDQQLDPVLAGVAGAAGERRPAADPDRRDPHPRRQLDAERRGDDRAGVRALHGEHRVAVGDVADGDVVAAAPAPEPGEVGVVVGRVGDEQVAVAAEPVGEEVVDDAAAPRCTGTSTGRRRARSRRRRWRATSCRKRERARPLDLDLAHVGDVEHPRVGAHRGVLLEDPLVGDRHLPAGERHDLRPQLTCARRGVSAASVTVVARAY